MKVRCSKCGTELERQRNISNAICGNCLKESARRYSKSDKGKKARRRFFKSDKFKKWKKEYSKRKCLEAMAKLSEQVVFTDGGIPQFNGLNDKRWLLSTYRGNGYKIFKWLERVNGIEAYKIHYIHTFPNLYELWFKTEDGNIADKIFVGLIKDRKETTQKYKFYM